MTTKKVLFALASILLLAGSISAQVTPTTGTYTFTFNITLVSTLPASTQIGCTVELEVTGDKAGIPVETAASLATVSGKTASCTVTIPYSWTLDTPATDKVSRLYWITAPANDTVATPAPSRVTHVNYGTTSVPANGSTTTATVNATF